MVTKRRPSIKDAFQPPQVPAETKSAPDVQGGAGGDEEQAQQDAAEGLDVCLHLRLEVGLCRGRRGESGRAGEAQAAPKPIGCLHQLPFKRKKDSLHSSLGPCPVQALCGQAVLGTSPDSRTPATKAPSVSLKPMRCVRRLAPVTVSRHSATNVSSLLASATNSNTLRGWGGVGETGNSVALGGWSKEDGRQHCRQTVQAGMAWLDPTTSKQLSRQAGWQATRSRHVRTGA